MNLLHLEQFYEVAKAGNVSVAARKLRVSQPAVSKSVRLLEESLGAKLFTRSRLGVQLTSEGEIAFEHAGRIFAETRRLSDRIDGGKSALTGEWCLGTSDNLAIHLLPPVIARMKNEHPELRIQIFSGASSAIKEELHSDRCDAGMFFTPPGSSEPFRFEPVHETEFWIVLAASSPWAKRRGTRRSPWTIADLVKTGIPAIQSRQKDYAGGFPAHFHSRKLALPEEDFMEANLHEVKKRLVLEGAGYSILVRHTVEKEVASGELIRVATPSRLPAPIYWVTLKRRATHRASTEFLRIAREMKVLVHSPS